MENQVRLTDPGPAKEITLNVFWAIVITCYGFVFASIAAAF